MYTIRLLSIIFCLTSLAHVANAQVLGSVYEGMDDDSSYYDIYQVSENDIWIGGEYGVLKRMKEDGSLENISIPNTGSNILKFLKLGNYMYISADHGTIYKYHLLNGECTITSFKSFKHRCFYDLAYDGNGNLLVSGGSSGIGRGKKRIPNGFIASIDTSLNIEPKVVWNNPLKFVWALSENPSGGISAAVFNGVSSRIYSSTEILNDTWVPGKKVKGLIHALQPIDGKLAYSGCRSIRYHKTGIWGFENEENSYKQVNGAGIICNLVNIKGSIYGFSSQGNVYRLNANGSEEPLYKTHDGFALYEAIVKNDDSILLVGHGKSAFLLKIEE
ncbi:MAG: hypothetical protein WED33_07920 [Bacteroidia bacterium]